MAKKRKKFEDVLGELESLVEELESGETDLDRALEVFEKGVGLVSDCRRRLADAEKKLKAIEKKGSEDSSL